MGEFQEMEGMDLFMFIGRLIGFSTFPIPLAAMIMFYIFSLLFKTIDRSAEVYLFNQAHSFDMTCNSLLNGDKHKTMSGRMGRHIKSGKAPKWMKLLCKFLSWQDPIKKKHCQEVYEIEVKEY